MLIHALVLSAFAAEPPPLVTRCTWTDAPWEQYAKLYVQGTGVAFGYSSAYPGDGVALDGELGFDVYGQPRLRAKLVGHGLTVYADLDPRAGGLFHLDGGALDVGYATIVEKGELSVVAWSDSGVVVAPDPSAREVRTTVPSWASVTCDRLNVLEQWPPQDGAELVAAAGLPKPIDVPAFAKKGAVTLYDAPHGRKVGIVLKQSYQRVVYVLEQRDGWAHVALTSWTGVVWDGWTDAAFDEETDGAGGLGLLGSLSDGEPYEVHRCDAELPLYGGLAKAPVQVGTVAAGTAFRVTGDRGDRVAVQLEASWLTAIDGGELWLPATAASCPAETVQPEQQGIEGALEVE